jgi:hypothetical protein
VYHELSHCACGRDHDHDGKKYGDGTEDRKDPKRADEFWNDGCPKSIMFPFIIEDSCTLSHYDQYIDEMFEKCVVY